LCGQAAFSSSTDKGRTPEALTKFTSPKVVERDGLLRRFSHSNAEPHLPAPQRLDPQDSRMDLFLRRGVLKAVGMFVTFSEVSGKSKHFCSLNYDFSRRKPRFFRVSNFF
jgi:hypothetical protein